MRKSASLNGVVFKNSVGRQGREPVGATAPLRWFTPVGRCLAEAAGERLVATGAAGPPVVRVQGLVNKCAVLPVSRGCIPAVEGLLFPSFTFCASSVGQQVGRFAGIAWRRLILWEGHSMVGEGEGAGRPRLRGSVGGRLSKSGKGYARAERPGKESVFTRVHIYTISVQKSIQKLNTWGKASCWGRWIGWRLGRVRWRGWSIVGVWRERYTHRRVVACPRGTIG